MGQELHFVERANGKWFYLLERRDAPKDAWDWLDYAEVFGPFASYEEAAEHEYRSDSDTSGATVIHFKARGKQDFAAEDRLIDQFLAAAADRASRS